MDKIEEFIKRYEIILILINTFLLFGFGILCLLVGKNIYGIDASILWASGILTYIGIQGFVFIIKFIWDETKNAKRTI